MKTDQRAKKRKASIPVIDLDKDSLSDPDSTVKERTATLICEDTQLQDESHTMN